MTIQEQWKPTKSRELGTNDHNTELQSWNNTPIEPSLFTPGVGVCECIIYFITDLVCNPSIDSALTNT